MSDPTRSPLSSPPPPVTLRLDAAGYSLELADPATLEAFFATVSYRLEPEGWATRFPLTLDGLNAGRLTPAEAPAILAELDLIAAELRALPSRKAVWDYQDTRLREDAGLPVRHGAASLHDYFVAADGRTPLVTRLREVAEAARSRGVAVRVGTARARADFRRAVSLLGFGLAAGTAALVWFPDYVLTSHGAHDGPLAWAVGYLVASFGAWGLMEARRPALSAWRRRHPWLAWTAALLVTVAVIVAGWRGGRPPTTAPAGGQQDAAARLLCASFPLIPEPRRSA